MLRQYKGDFLSSSGESESDPEVGNILKLCNVKCAFTFSIFRCWRMEIWSKSMVGNTAVSLESSMILMRTKRIQVKTNQNTVL